MSITKIEKVSESGDISMESRNTSVEYICYSDSPNDAIVDVLSSPMLPRINSFLEEDRRQSLEGKSGERLAPKDDFYLFKVKCQYKTTTGDEEGGEKDEVEVATITYPWDLPPFNVNYGVLSREVVAVKAYLPGDNRGEPTRDILNSAGDVFDPPITRFVKNGVMSFSYNLRSYNPLWTKTYINELLLTENLTVLDIPLETHRARIINLGATPIDYTQDGVLNSRYWQVDCEIEYSEEDLVEYILDVGFSQQLESQKVKIMIKDEEDNLVYPVVPQLLNGFGEVLTPPTEPYYHHFTLDYPSDWSVLNLPKSINKVIPNE